MMMIFISCLSPVFHSFVTFCHLALVTVSFILMMMMMMMMILLQNVMMMMIKDEQEVTKTLDHSDTGQAHMKT